MARINSKVSSVGELIAVVEIKDMLARLETKVDLLLSKSDRTLETSEPSEADLGGEDDGEWIEGLDPMTRFNLERGWITAEEVREGLRGE